MQWLNKTQDERADLLKPYESADRELSKEQFDLHLSNLEEKKHNKRKQVEEEHLGAFRALLR